MTDFTGGNPTVCIARSSMESLSDTSLGLQKELMDLEMRDGIRNIDETVAIKQTFEATNAEFKQQLGENCMIICGVITCFLKSGTGDTLRTAIDEELGTFTEMVNKRKEQQTLKIKLETPDGPFMKEFFKKRIDVLEDPELVTKVLAHHNRNHPDELISDYEWIEGIRELVTPVKDDATWDALARFIKGNLFAAQTLMAYFHKVFPIFRMDADPAMAEKARSIANDMHVRDGSWSHTYPGFRPANPYEITEMDFYNLAHLVSDRGVVWLPTGHGGHTAFKITDDPEEYAEWKLKDGEVIDIIHGKRNELPARHQPRQITEVSSAVKED